MSFENNGEIKLYENHGKKTEKSPDFTGYIELHGTKYRASVWIQKGGLGGVIGELKTDAPGLPKHPGR